MTTGCCSFHSNLAISNNDRNMQWRT